MRTILQCIPVCAVGLAALTVVAAPTDAFDVVWDSPSANHHGSMPLGNGDIALNAWMTPDGDLQFYISKTDAWDDNARLLKVGKVRLHFEPNPIVTGRAFRQELKLGEGRIEITAGDPAECRILLWVDANHPVVQVTAESVKPVEVTAFVELWRTNQQEQAELQVSDVLMNRKQPDQRQVTMVIEPDTVLSGQRDRVGWYHHNIKSVGPEMLAEVQGLTGFKQPDPLLYRTFGAVITADKGERLDDRRLRSPRSNSHRFSVFVLTRHPSTSEQWLGDMDKAIRRVEAQSFAPRRRAHNEWWKEFWNRSWMRASANTNARPSLASIVPTNGHPVRIGIDQVGDNKFAGELGRLSVFNETLPEAEIQALARSDHHPLAGKPKMLFSVDALGVISNSAGWDFGPGMSVEAWVKPQTLPGVGARLMDKITPGGSDGFLLDTHPGNSLRFICGQTILQQPEALPADRWTHVAAVADSAAGGCRLYVDGNLVASSTGETLGDEAAYVSRMYHLQRFITACAGRGAYPIKFNGLLFTIPPGPTEKDPDYRRWGPGYWWQNTRLPYISLCASGDFDLQRPLFHMYADDLLPLCKYRTKLYLGHDGAYYPECIMFWGAVFSEKIGRAHV